MPKTDTTTLKNQKARIELSGQRFGRLTILCEADRRQSRRFWLCQCDCGNTKEIYQHSLTGGITHSCGCLRKEVVSKSRSTHGYSRQGCVTLVHKCWSGIRERCTNPRRENYKYYGARGIKVCKRWDKFENFLADMGDLPFKGATIERIDNDGDYEPSNCRWATKKEQGRNQRRNHHVTFKDQTKTLAEWSEITGISPGLLWFRMTAGWTPERALTTPPRSYPSR